MTKSEAAQPAPWLPEGWTEVERVEDRIVADGLALDRAGVCVQAPSGAHLTGSAAGLAESPMPRARFEALERAAVLDVLASDCAMFTLRDGEGRATGLVPRSVVFPESDAPDVWRFARSNGVALHDGWAAACERAWWEARERERILRAWLGETTPRIVDVARGDAVWSQATSYDWCVARFDDVDGSALPVEVAGVFGFPRVAAAPMIVGYGARPTLAEAIRAAGGEALQNLAFLWGEEIPTARPPQGPTPVHHVDHLLWPGSHATLRAWLAEGHAAHRAHGLPHRPAIELVGFVDLTPAWLAGRACVCRAVTRGGVPLTFGADPRWSHLPPDLRVHPIP